MNRLTNATRDNLPAILVLFAFKYDVRMSNEGHRRTKRALALALEVIGGP